MSLNEIKFCLHLARPENNKELRDVPVLPGAEVSEAGLAFGLLGRRCPAGGRSALIFSSRTFSEGEEPQCQHTEDLRNQLPLQT